MLSTIAKKTFESVRENSGPMMEAIKNYAIETFRNIDWKTVLQSPVKVIGDKYGDMKKNGDLDAIKEGTAKHLKTGGEYLQKSVDAVRTHLDSNWDTYKEKVSNIGGQAWKILHDEIKKAGLMTGVNQIGNSDRDKDSRLARREYMDLFYNRKRS